MERVPFDGLNEQSKTEEDARLGRAARLRCSGGGRVADDGVGLLVGVSEFEERAGAVLLTDLDHAARRQLLYLMSARSGSWRWCRNPHEADGSGGSQNGDLAVAVSHASPPGARASVPAGFGKRRRSMPGRCSC